KVYRPVGCPECRQTGFRGRTGLYELLTISPAFAKLIQPTVDLRVLQQQSVQDGMNPLAIAGAMKVAAGVTTIEEVLKVTAAQSYLAASAPAHHAPSDNASAHATPFSGAG